MCFQSVLLDSVESDETHTLCMTPSHVKPALLTMICIFPCPNSADLLTSSSMYLASNMSPGIAVAFPPVSLISLATAAALPNPHSVVSGIFHRDNRFFMRAPMMSRMDDLSGIKGSTSAHLHRYPGPRPWHPL